MIAIKIDARQLAPAIQTYVQGGKEMRRVAMRAINWTGDRCTTQVQRALAKTTGAPYNTVREAIKEVRATPNNLEFAIQASGKKIPLKEFGARQTQAGVSATAWGKRRVFPSTFIVDSLGGNVFVRKTFSWAGGKKVPRFPIRKLYGPSIPSELVEQSVVDVFNATVAANLTDRLQHETQRMLQEVAAKAKP